MVNQFFRIGFMQAVLMMFLAGVVLAGSVSSPGEIRIITPRWEGQTNADGSGFFFDIIRAVYEPEGISLRFSFAPWKRCQARVIAGREDAMLCVWKAQARRQKLLIPKIPMYIERTAAVVKKASGIDWQGIHSLDYRRVVWLRGYNYNQDRHMAGIQLADWHEVDTREEAWKQLNRDRFEVFMDALIDIEKDLGAGEIQAGLYRSHLLWKEKAYVAFSDTSRSRELIRMYDARAQSLLSSGRLAGIYRRWGQPFDPEDWKD